MGLDLIRRAVMSAEKDARRSVGDSDVEQAIAAHLNLHKLDVIDALSAEELLVLKTAAALFTPETSPTTREVLDALPADGPKNTRASEILNLLEILGLVDLEYATSGAGRRRYVHIHGEKDEFLKLIAAAGSPGSKQ